MEQSLPRRCFNDRTDQYGGSLENRARLLREVLEDTLEECDGGAAVACRIVVDELVSNSVVHAATPIVVTLEYSGDVCRCAVSDRGASGPLPRVLERADGSGRGLRIVNAIASAWGVERSDVGTTVWVEVGPGA